MNEVLQKILAEIEALLIDQIPKVVAENRKVFKEPVYCLHIWYNGSDSASDAVPWLMFVRESTRQLLQERDQNYKILSADDVDAESGWTYPFSIDDPRLQELYLPWYEFLCSDPDEEAESEEERIRYFHEMIQRVCKVLNGFDWSQIIPVTDDFVVLPADGSHTLGDGKEEMREYVPEAKMMLLEERGYFW